MGKRKRRKKRKRNVPAPPGQANRRYKSTTFKIGRSVIVKDGIEDPDLDDVDLSGWQGLITAIEDSEEGKWITIQWDSLTLRAMPGWIIETCKERNLAWKLMRLGESDLELTSSRDLPADVDKITTELRQYYAWACLGEQGKRIQRVLGNAGKEEDDIETFDTWRAYLRAHLEFPFDAKVSEYQRRGPLQAGDRVVVESIEAMEDIYGVLAGIETGGQRLLFPLYELEVCVQESKNFQLVDDYAVWFANR